jgi:hypothetical protein
MISNFPEFVNALLEAGFSTGSRNSEGIFSISSRYAPTVLEHTGDPETDPWEWRMRVLEERDDIAYGKVFFRKSGWICRDWYPCFLAVRRAGQTFEDAYRAGTISQQSRRVYDCVRERGRVPLHEIKRLAGFQREEQGAFERALVDLQMRLFLTMCGRQQKISPATGEYGWASTVFCTPELYFGEKVFTQATQLSEQAAFERIADQIRQLNPAADSHKIARFIRG